MQDIDPTGGSSAADALGRKVASAVDDVATVEVLLWAVVLASVALDVYTTRAGGTVIKEVIYRQAAWEWQ